MGACGSSKNKASISSIDDQPLPSTEQVPDTIPRTTTTSTNSLFPISRLMFRNSSLKLANINSNASEPCNHELIDELNNIKSENQKLKQEIHRLNSLDRSENSIQLTTDFLRSHSCTRYCCTENNPNAQIYSMDRVGIVFNSNSIKQYVCNGDLKECLHLMQLSKTMEQYVNCTVPDIETANMCMILNNFLHLLETHNDNHDDFECIFHILGGRCDAVNCEIFARNHRLRSNTEQCNRDHCVVYSQILDKIHCFYRHCFDIGNRLCKSDTLSLQNYTEIQPKVQSDICCLLNAELPKLQQILKDKRGKLTHFAGFTQRMRLKSSQLTHADELKLSNDDRYNFGNSIKYEQCNSTPMTALVFASPKYSSLLEEITSNNICPLSAEQFKCEYQKSELYFDSWYRKKRYPKLLLEQLLSMMIYCNYTTLQFEFSKTYRDNFVSKHNNFYYLAQNLKMLVRQFGTEIQNGKINIFYHGISRQLHFPAYISNIYINGPLSTTSSFPVALNFTNQNNGMVVEFNGWKQSKCRYFSTSWLSDFGNEFEHFFIQNQHSLEISNITLCEPGLEFETILNALKVIDSFAKHGKCIENIITEKQQRLIQKIMEDRLPNWSNKYKAFDSLLNEYGSNLILTYFQNKKKLYIGDFVSDNIYRFLLDYYINGQILKLKEISVIYPNLQQIYVSNMEVCKETMENILCVLDGMNECKLTKIVIKCVSPILANFCDSFNGKQFNLSISADSIIIEKMKYV